MTPLGLARGELRLAQLPSASVALLRAAHAAAPETALVVVGGTVRDALLGRADADVDLAVPHGALVITERIAAWLGATAVVLDAERGAGRVAARGVRLDVSDFRAPSLEADLRARDFTVNALAVDLGRLLRVGRAPLVDPTGGLADLRARRLRPAGPDVLAADPLRVLRGVRLEATLGFRLTPAAARALRTAAPGLARVAAERVSEELTALLRVPRTGRAVRRADALGVLRVVLPEVEPMRAAAQPAPHRFNVLEHSLRALESCDRVLAHLGALDPFGEELAAHLAEPVGGTLTRAHVLKLAALLHDVSKPETRRLVNGRVRFFEHDVLGAARARDIGGRLRLPARAVSLLERLVRHHLRPMHLAQAGEVTRRARLRFYRDLGSDTRDLLLLTLVDAAAVTGVSPLTVWRRATLIRDLLSGWAEAETTVAVAPLLRGEDVMARFGLPPGPAVGHLLSRAREAQDLGLVRTREEALAYLDSSGTAP
ncbi:MAG TPA: HDIG domain-containing protein [Methylomirabilota bacterium]|nr:HDIG domain-containing protein [Methylomirabilota bacterium]